MAVIANLRPRLRRVLSKYHIPPHEAEDLLQETMLVAFLRWDSIQSKEGWLMVTLSHKCSIYWRDQRRCPLQPMDLDMLEGFAPPQPAEQEKDELHWDLERLLSKLGPRHRALLRLRYYQGLSTDEIAERLGYNGSSVRKLCCRSVERLRRLAQNGEGDPPPPAEA